MGIGGQKNVQRHFRKSPSVITHLLAFADPTKPYILHVDASQNGLGAVLNQEYLEGLRPVAS